jgi:hypothetical protein
MLNLIAPHNAPGKSALSQNKAAQGIGTLVSPKLIGRGDQARGPSSQMSVVGK